MSEREEVLREFLASYDDFRLFPNATVNAMADCIAQQKARIRELEEERNNGAKWFDAYLQLEDALWAAVGIDSVPDPDPNGHVNDVNLACLRLLTDRILALEGDVKKWRSRATDKHLRIGTLTDRIREQADRIRELEAQQTPGEPVAQVIAVVQDVRGTWGQKAERQTVQWLTDAPPVGTPLYAYPRPRVEGTNDHTEVKASPASPTDPRLSREYRTWT